MYHYPKAARGIQLLFLSIILAILSAPLSMLGIGSIVSVVSIVLQLVALFIAAGDDSGYRSALYASVANLVLNLLCNFVQQDSVVYKLVSNVSSIVALYMTYQVITITCYLLMEKAPNVASQGQTVAKIYVMCFVITFICRFLELVPFIGLMARLIYILASLVELVGYVLFLVFLFRASTALK